MNTIWLLGYPTLSCDLIVTWVLWDGQSSRDYDWYHEAF